MPFRKVIFSTFVRTSILLLLVIAPSVAKSQMIPPEERAAFTRNPEAYQRYTTPMQCLFATERELLTVWRAPNSFDTASYQTALRIDTFPVRSIEAARQCLGALHLDKLQQEQRVFAGKLALRAKLDSLADTLLGTLIQSRLSSPGARTHDWILKQVGDVYTFEKPIRIDALKALVLKLENDDSLRYGVGSDLREQLRKHSRSLGDFSDAAQQDRTIIQLFDQRWGDSVRKSLDLQSVALKYLRDLHSDTDLADGIAAAQPIVTDMRARVTAWGYDSTNPFGHISARGWYEALIQLHNRRYIFTDSVFGYRVPVPIPTINGDAWLRRPDTLHRPVAGRVTLIVTGMEYVLAAKNFRWMGDFSVLRRLHQKYAARGFEIVYTMQSRGFFRDSPVLTFEQERDTVGAALDYFKLPGIVALERTEFSVRPDRKRIPNTTPNGWLAQSLQMQSGRLLERAFLVDRKGNLLTTAAVLRFDQANEAVLSRLIERALQDGERAVR